MKKSSLKQLIKECLSENFDDAINITPSDETGITKFTSPSNQLAVGSGKKGNTPYDEMRKLRIAFKQNDELVLKQANKIIKLATPTMMKHWDDATKKDIFWVLFAIAYNMKGTGSDKKREDDLNLFHESLDLDDDDLNQFKSTKKDTAKKPHDWYKQSLIQYQDEIRAGRPVFLFSHPEVVKIGKEVLKSWSKIMNTKKPEKSDVEALTNWRRSILHPTTGGETNPDTLKKGSASLVIYGTHFLKKKGIPLKYPITP
jgi:hypothetical protein